MKKFAVSAILAGAVLMTAGMASAQIDTFYVGDIDITSQLTAVANGVHPAHIDAYVSGGTVTLYVTTLNNSAAVANIPALKITDALGTPVISQLDLNDGNAGAGVSVTRGYGGVAVDGSGNVFVAWAGNGSDDSARVRRYDTSGAQTGQWLWATLNDRLNGIAVNAAGTAFVGARFFSTATKTGHFAITDASTLVRTTAATPATATASNPRDLAYDAAANKLYINANGQLEVITAANPTDIAPATEWAAGTTTILQNPAANSHAAYGVCINADGSLIGYSPSQNAGVGAKTFRIVDPAGVTQATIGTLDVSGTFTDGNLFRGTDGVFFTVGGVDYIAITDTDFVDDHRVAIYSLAPASVSEWQLLN